MLPKTHKNQLKMHIKIEMSANKYPLCSPKATSNSFFFLNSVEWVISIKMKNKKKTNKIASKLMALTRPQGRP